MATSVNAFVCCVFAFLVWFAFFSLSPPKLGTTNSYPCRHLCFARIYTHFCYLCMHEYTIFLYIAIYVIVLYTIRWYIDTYSLTHWTSACHVWPATIVFVGTPPSCVRFLPSRLAGFYRTKHPFSRNPGIIFNIHKWWITMFGGDE